MDRAIDPKFGLHVSNELLLYLKKHRGLRAQLLLFLAYLGLCQTTVKELIVKIINI